MQMLRFNKTITDLSLAGGFRNKISWKTSRELSRRYWGSYFRNLQKERGM